MLSSSDSEISELDSPPSPAILFDVLSGDPNIVDGKFEDSPVALLSRNAGAFLLTGVDVTGTYVFSSSVVVDESVTLITLVVPPPITCAGCPSEDGDPEENASMGCTSVPK